MKPAQVIEGYKDGGHRHVYGGGEKLDGTLLVGRAVQPVLEELAALVSLEPGKIP